MDKKLSIIIPVYKAEKYLEKCVNKLQQQTYRNIEIILIDDGSPDNCPQICDRLSERDERIKVVHKKNQGPSSARNAGLEICSGDYITFCDADDELSDSLIYEKCMKLFDEKEIDAVFFGAHFCKEGKIIETFRLEDKVVMVDDSIRCEVLKKKFPLSGYLWCKIYKKSSILIGSKEVIQFDDEKFAYEDMIWILKSLSSIHKIAMTSAVGYMYYIRENSISRARDNRVNIAKNGVDAYKDIEAYYKNNSQKKPLYAAREMIIYIILMKIIVALKDQDMEMVIGMKAVYYKNRTKIIYSRSLRLWLWNIVISLLYITKFRKG